VFEAVKSEKLMFATLLSTSCARVASDLCCECTTPPYEDNNDISWSTISDAFRKERVISQSFVVFSSKQMYLSWQALEIAAAMSRQLGMPYIAEDINITHEV
jgi:hypothetical protein